MPAKTLSTLFVICLFIGCSQKATLPIVEERASFIPEVSKPAVLGETLPFVTDQPCKLSGSKLTQSSCSEGQLCMAKDGASDQGQCMIECGQKVGDRLVKNQAKCPKDWRCMARKTPELAIIGYFCARPQQYRDQPCEGPFDEDACASSMTCMPTIMAKNAQGKMIFARTLCKEECMSDSQCRRDGESCLKPQYARLDAQKQPNDNRPIECSINGCQNAAGNCACDKTQGFSCKRSLPGLDQGLCLRSLGVCGHAIPWAQAADFRGKTFLGPTCNELTDNRFCKNPFAKESPINAKTMCVPLSSTKEGACVAICALPALEAGRLSKPAFCPADFSCQTGLARKFGLVALIKDEAGHKGCDFSKCRVDSPCPEECGPGQAECLEVTLDGKKGHFCGSPYGLCEPH